MSDIKMDFSWLEEVLPEIVWRCRWDKLAARHGLPYRRTYMQNLDSLGDGPPKHYFGKRVAYFRGELIHWLNSRVAAIPSSSESVPSWLDR